MFILNVYNIWTLSALLGKQYAHVFCNNCLAFFKHLFILYFITNYFNLTNKRNVERVGYSLNI